SCLVLLPRSPRSTLFPYTTLFRSERYGVEKVYTPEDGRRSGLKGMIEDVCSRVRRAQRPSITLDSVDARDFTQVARAISLIEEAQHDDERMAVLRQVLVEADRAAPVVGLTGTGGAGKSSLNDELLQRFVRNFPERRIAVVAMDPTRRRSGGALLGDRIRMNALAAPTIFMRSLATRRHHAATSAVLADV